ncbi:NUAK family SNF1-like kinase 1 [Polypterus senegalus]|uniref:NUAK family SNF1-like kinase 1 n=1 Tax=Polypterus senegalus TaxID=55291 RepID=UPI00196279A0|nr:NUAK family SNF1-like kinase 1 [Polypterus senegalus]
MSCSHTTVRIVPCICLTRGERKKRVALREECEWSDRADMDATLAPVQSERLSPLLHAADSGKVRKHQHKHNLKHRYELLETLGTGTYGKVKRAMERFSGRVVAIKSIRKEKIKDEQDMVHIRREIEIMSSLQHPHIISIYEVFENKDKIVIVMEYASKGELYDYISERRRLTERETRHFFRQIVSAVHYCHKNGVVHRDLKLENILLDENCNIKLADFGLSNLYHKDRLLQTFCGSPLYASPEIVNGRPYHGPEVDSWALGVLLYTLVYGAMPFIGGDHKNLISQISSGEYREPTQSSDARGLIRWMLMVNPDRRATIEDIANHWWVNWGYKSSVCDCDALHEAGSPLLARFIDWQHRSSGMQPEGESKNAKVPYRVENTTPCQRSVRKSKKENDVVHCLGDEDKPGLKRPKGILKSHIPREQRSHSVGAIPVNTLPQEAGLTDNLDPDKANFVSPSKMAAEANTSLPKKGILKKTPQRESGYYSSPEHSESCDQFGVGGQSPRKISSVKKSFGRKGILKRNGKYSTSSTLPAMPATGVNCSDCTSASGLYRSQSRPSSVVSDDSNLSNESFELLDWPECAGSTAVVGVSKIRSCVSAENLLHLGEFGRLKVQPPVDGVHFYHKSCSSGKDSGSFSLLADMEDMTQVYQQALEISSSLT